MSHRTSSSSTQNFRQDYRVNPTPAQSSQYREHQQAYQQMPSGTYDRLRASGDVLDSKTKVYKERKEERLDVERRTEAARMERRDRTDPDIQAVRNARNREERALRGLDHAQRRYNEDPDAARYANTINGNHDNMTQVASRNRMPGEMVGSVTRYANVPSYPQELPARRQQRDTDLRSRRDRD